MNSNYSNSNSLPIYRATYRDPASEPSVQESWPAQPLQPPVVQTRPLDPPANPAEELTDAISRSHEVMCSATTVFPFTLFPDTITIDREKITIAHRFFFRLAEEFSIRIEDILNVTADVGPFFGSLKIQTRFFERSKPYRINYLWRSDAERVKRILQGYIIATQKHIDCSHFSGPELAKLLDSLGQEQLD